MQEKIKVALYCSGGLERGYQVGYESLAKLMGEWDIDLFHTNINSPTLNDFQDMAKKYEEGYKVITSGIPINSILASVTQTDIVDPADVTKKDPSTIFNKLYVNKKELTIDSDGLSFKCLPIWHPLYYIESKMQGGVANIIKTIRSYIGLNPRENEKILHSSRSSKELEKFINRFIKEEEFYVAYDIETNFISPLMEGFSITGFSLAFNNKEGIYVVLNSSDFNMDDDERLRCLGLLKSVLTHPKSKVIVHNLKMEVPATLNEIDYEIPESKIEDTLVWSKLINSGKTGGNGLKEQAIYRLGYSDWSEDVDTIQSLKEDIKKQISATDRKGNRKINYKEFSSEELNSLIFKYYGCDEYLKVSRELINKLEASDNIYSFGLIPARILEKYGAIDAIATFDLFIKYHEMIKELNKKFNLDMEVGYKLWMESMYASYLLELNSSRWDETQAYSDERAFIRIMEEDLRYLLSSDDDTMRKHVKQFIRYESMEDMFKHDEFKGDIESNELFQGYTGTGKIRYTDISSNKVKNINPDKYEDIMKIFNLSENALTVKTNMKYEQLMMDRFSSWNLEKLKSVLNPNSDIGKKLIMGIIQDDLIKSSKFIIDICAYMSSDTYKIDMANKEFNQGEEELLALINTYDANKSSKEKFELYESIMKKLGEVRIGSLLSRKIVEAGEWHMETLDEVNMTELYNLYSIAGFDIDNDHKGDSPFARLFHIRRYKKVDKLLTTYIYGSKLGRSQVYVVDKNEFQSGKKLVKRKRQYTPGEELAENEDLLFQGTWAANSVLSGRWSSGIHTLPAWSDPKRYLSSRFKGGCSVIADFSQAEIRVVARASNEENLLNAYANGEDVHMKTAMNIFHKPASEISEVERRFSKMGCLVGNTKIKLMNGSTKTIEEVYDDWCKYKTPFYVPSFDKNKGLTVGRCVNVQLTKYTDRICRVTFNDGNILECTPDHPLLMKGRENKYINSENSLDSEIEALYYRYQEKGAYYGYEQWRDTYIEKKNNKGIPCGFTGRWEMTHVISAKEYGILGDKGQINHIDNNRVNNDRYNLEYLDISSHARKTRESLQDGFGMNSQFHKIKRYMIDNKIPMNAENYNNARWMVYPTNYIHGIASPRYETLERIYGSIDNIPEPREVRVFDYFPTCKGQSTKNPNCKKVIKVEIINLENPVPVYDLSVEKYHNYVVDFCDGSGIYVHNTFHILYGGDPAGFANSYLNGDLAYANKIFEGFYGGYPKLKIWKDSKVEEVKKYGLVTTMTNRYIFLGHEQPGMSIDKIVRQSGNAPIQGPSSDIAASAVFNISDFIEKKNLKSKLYCFIHDSIEADVSPDELFYVMESFQYQMNNYPYDRFKVPAKSDLTIGATLGEEVEVISYKPDSDYKGGYLHLEGSGDEVDRLLARWSEFWDIINVRWIKRKNKYNSYRELFAVKRSFTRRIGVVNSKVELEVVLRFTEGKGCKEKFPEYSNLFPLEKPLLNKELTPYTEYTCTNNDNIKVYINKDLKGIYMNSNGNMKSEFEFKSKEEMNDYLTKYGFTKVGLIGM